MSAEQRILSAWKQVLESDDISPDDNFFEVGGDSVSALRVVNLLAEDGMTISLRDFYLKATAAGQARHTTAATVARGARRVSPDGTGSTRLPLTPLQSIMVVEALRRPDSEAYWLTLAYALPAGTGPEEAQSAWQKTVRANPALRTRICIDGSGPFQTIGPEGPALRIAAPEDPTRGPGLATWCRARSAELRGRFLQEPLRAYYLPGKSPDAQEASLVIACHHALMDGWSMEQCVADFHHSLAVPHAPLPRRASGESYLSWLEDTDAPAVSKEYWQHQMRGAEPAPSLPFMQPGDDARDGEEQVPRTVDRQLSGEAAQCLSRFARRHGLTRASIFTTLWMHILRQYQDSADVSVGLTVNNRPAAELPGISEASGFLINTLPLRLALSDDFTADCRRVLEQTATISEHAHLPYSEVVEAAGLPGMTHLFTSTLIFQNVRRGAEITRAPVHPLFAHGSSVDELSLTVELEEDGVRVCTAWDAALYDCAAVESLVHDLEYWLAHLEDVDPAAGLTSPHDVSRALSGSAAEPRPWCMGELLAVGEPGRTAVAQEATEVTYAQLRRRAAALAAWLAAEHGVGAGDRVALVGERGTQGVVALCAVWLLGAAWCPVSSSWPAERQEQTLRVLRPKAVVDLAALGPSADGAGRPLPEPSPEAVRDLMGRTMSPEAVAYYVPTSGSSGEPKLVALSAGGLRPVVDAWLQHYGLAGTAQHVLQFGSWASDVFLGDVLKVMATGGSLVICPDEARVDLDCVEDLVRSWRITLLESTPAVVTALLRHLSRAQSPPADLHTLIVGADTFRIREAEEATARLWQGVRLHNGYGLSECTIESLVQECVPALAARSGLCPVGRPLPGTCITVVDGRGRPLPYGAVGELVVAGAQVGLGYLTEDGLTEGGQFATVDGVRHFRTGDLVRFGPDGCLEFHGRRDGLVKVRGHRVEVGEVEDRLLRLPGVEESFVCLAERAVQPELVAFIGGSGLDERAVRDGLSQTLPEHAVPGRVVVERRLPRNDHGKLDRVRMRNRAVELPRKNWNVDRSTDACEADELSALLTGLWSEVLQRPVNPHRSFFDQGGNSILAMQLYARMRELLPQHEFPIAHLFIHPTIAAFRASLSASPPASPHPREAKRSGPADELAVLRALERGELDTDGAMRLLRDRTPRQSGGQP